MTRGKRENHIFKQIHKQRIIYYIKVKIKQKISAGIMHLKYLLLVFAFAIVSTGNI